MPEPYKWHINPTACLRELGRMDDEPGYRKTICSIHRIIWTKINIDLNGYIPEEKLEEVNDLLEIAFMMGKRMDHRLVQYHALVNGLPVANPMALAELHMKEVLFPEEPLKETLVKAKERKKRKGWK